jgi:CDP-glucose 4,6-dehydratase
MSVTPHSTPPGKSANAHWNERRVLVTGAGGFLGGWVVRELRERGADVVGLERDRQHRPVRHGGIAADYTVHGDIRDLPLLIRVLNEYEVDTVMHLAAQPIVGVANLHPVSTFEANILGTWTLMEACRQVPRVRSIVIASSDKAYGTSEILPYTEAMPLRGTHPYDVSKSCADLIAQTYHATYGTPVCVTRCANFYGGGDLNFSRIVPGTVRSVFNGKAPVLRSDGTMVRDYIYVRDVAAAYLCLAEAMQDQNIHGRAYNFSLEHPLSVLEITRLITRLMERPDLEPIILNEVKGEIPAQYLSAARARTELGWSPRQSLEASLLETIGWYRTYFGEQNATLTSTF